MSNSYEAFAKRMSWVAQTLHHPYKCTEYTSIIRKISLSTGSNAWNKACVCNVRQYSYAWFFLISLSRSLFLCLQKRKKKEPSVIFLLLASHCNGKQEPTTKQINKYGIIKSDLCEYKDASVRCSNVSTWIYPRKIEKKRRKKHHYPIYLQMPRGWCLTNLHLNHHLLNGQ